MIEDRSKTEEIAKIGRQYVEKNLTWKAVAKRVENTFLDAVNSHRK